MNNRQTGFIDLATAASLSTVVSTIGNLGISAFGAIEGINLQKEQFELQEDIANRQLQIQEQSEARKLEIIDLQIESTRAANEIENQVQEAFADLKKSQVETLKLEEELKRELAAINFQEQTGRETTLVGNENSQVKVSGQATTATQGKSGGGALMLGALAVGSLLLISRRK